MISVVHCLDILTFTIQFYSVNIMHGHDTDWLTHAGHSSLVQSTSSGDTSAPGNDVIILCNGLMFDMHNFYSEPTLKELVQFLFPVASKWYLIGLLISVDELKRIREDSSRQPK